MLKGQYLWKLHVILAGNSNTVEIGRENLTIKNIPPLQMFWFKIHVSKLHQFYASTISKIIFEKPKINNYFILGYYLFITLGCLTFIILNIGFSMHTMNVLEIPYETWEYPHIFIFFIEFFGLLTFSAITFMPLTVVLALFVETAGNLRCSKS